MKILKLIFCDKKTHSKKVFPLWPDRSGRRERVKLTVYCYTCLNLLSYSFVDNLNPFKGATAHTWLIFLNDFIYSVFEQHWFSLYHHGREGSYWHSLSYFR